MTPFTILLPHKRNPGNDAALSIALDCLFRNTVNDFKLLIDAAYDQPLYARINRLVDQADTDCCVITSSDIFMAPGWDEPMLSAWNRDTFITGVVVEPGAIGVHQQNVHQDFGQTPAAFRRAEFEAWSQNGAAFPDGEGWVVPLMFSKMYWWDVGGLTTQSPDDFPEVPPDQELINRFKSIGGSVQRVRSYAYHLQRWSDVGEQEAEKRA